MKFFATELVARTASTKTLTKARCENCILGNCIERWSKLRAGSHRSSHHLIYSNLVPEHILQLNSSPIPTCSKYPCCCQVVFLRNWLITWEWQDISVILLKETWANSLLWLGYLSLDRVKAYGLLTRLRWESFNVKWWQGLDSEWPSKPGIYQASSNPSCDPFDNCSSCNGIEW